MFKKFAAITVALFIAVFVLSSCSSQAKDATPTKGSVSHVASATPQKVSNLYKTVGDWTAEGSTKDGGMAATIDDTGIVINWTGTDTTALYWKGTFPLSVINEPTSVTSKGDVKTMESSLMAESINPNSKKFTLKDGKIIFTVSMQGVTKTVTLKKD